MSINARLVWGLGTPQVGHCDLDVLSRTVEFGMVDEANGVTRLECWMPSASLMPPLGAGGLLFRCGQADHAVAHLEFAQVTDALGVTVSLVVKGVARPLVGPASGTMTASGFSAVAAPGGGPWPSGDLVDHDGAAALTALQRAADRQGVSVETLLARLEPPPPEPPPDGSRGIALDGLTRETHDGHPAA